jgi:hypothetical protein
MHQLFLGCHCTSPTLTFDAPQVYSEAEYLNLAHDCTAWRTMEENNLFLKRLKMYSICWV